MVLTLKIGSDGKLSEAVFVVGAETIPCRPQLVSELNALLSGEKPREMTALKAQFEFWDSLTS